MFWGQSLASARPLPMQMIACASQLHPAVQARRWKPSKQSLASSRQTLTQMIACASKLHLVAQARQPVPYVAVTLILLSLLRKKVSGGRAGHVARIRALPEASGAAEGEDPALRI